MAAIDVLSDDILREIIHLSIFGQCFLVPGLRHPRIAVSYGHHPSTPVVLSHISSRWRAVLHSTPALWTHICLVFTVVSRAPDDKDIEMLKVWLKHSQTMPLSISFCDPIAGGSWPDWLVTNFSNLLKVLVGHSSRWRSVTMRLNPRLFMDSWWQDLKVAILETCLMEYNNSSSVDRYNGTTDLYSRLCASPHLRSIELGAGWFRPCWVPSIPWRQLLQIKVDGRLDAKEALEMMSNCANLQDCALSDVEPLAEEYPHSFHELPYLRTLSFTCVLEAPRILNYLTLPSLSSFSIVAHTNSPQVTENIWGYLSLLGERSRWTLGCLRIIGKQHYFPATAPFHQNHRIISHPSFACLTHLAIKSITNEMLGVLTWSEDIMPLSLLTVLHLPLFRAQDALLFAMIASRLVDPEKRTLRRVHLTDMRVDVAEVIKKLESMFSGLVVSCPWEDKWMSDGMQTYEFWASEPEYLLQGFPDRSVYT